HVDHANRIILANEVIQALGQQRPLPTIRLLNKAPHQIPPESSENHNSRAAFSHSQGQKRTWAETEAMSAMGLQTSRRRKGGQLRPYSLGGSSRITHLASSQTSIGFPSK